MNRSLNYLFAALVMIVGISACDLPGRGGLGLEAGQKFKDCESCPEMVVLPKGRLMMGSTSAEQNWYKAPPQNGNPKHIANELPRHLVKIDYQLAVGRTEVTVGEWQHFLSKSLVYVVAYCGGQGSSHPVGCVDWAGALAYVNWLKLRTGKPYRLLSEAEWEYAARGKSGKKFRYWGDDPKNLIACEHENVGDSSGGKFPCVDGYKFTAPAAAFQANRFGLFDMLGNVLEWTQDCWNANYEVAPADGSAWENGDCENRVVRGGSYTNMPRHVRAAKRGFNPVDRRDPYLGFRVAVTLNQ